MSNERMLVLLPESLFPTDSGGKRSRLGHLRELLDDPSAGNVSVAYVDMEGSGDVGIAPFSALGCGVERFAREVPRVLDGMRGVFMALCGLLSRYPRVPWARRSREARAHVLAAVEDPDVQVVAEGIGALALLPAGRGAVDAAWIVHNLEWVDTAHRARGYGPTHPLHWVLRWEARKSRRFELGWLKRLRRAVFISPPDMEIVRQALPEVAHRFVACPELIPPSNARWAWAEGASLLFVGDVDYFPNRDALEWLVHEFMPELWRILPDARLEVVGTRREQVSWIDDRRLVVHGRVSDAELTRLHMSSTLSVSPIRYGSGVKMKVLDAAAHGMPIAATPEGLRGTRFFDVALRLDRSDVHASASSVADLLGCREALEARAQASARALEDSCGARPSLHSALFDSFVERS